MEPMLNAKKKSNASKTIGEIFREDEEKSESDR